MYFSFDAYAGKCKACKSSIPKDEAYCHGCAYNKGCYFLFVGFCKICGVKILNVKCYR